MVKKLLVGLVLLLVLAAAGFGLATQLSRREPVHLSCSDYCL